MGELMLRCHNTGRDFSTRIEVDKDSFKKLPNVAISHLWWTREARLIEYFNLQRRHRSEFVPQNLPRMPA
jgi:hypothetical protein